jgi:hypothetical protein
LGAKALKLCCVRISHITRWPIQRLWPALFNAPHLLQVCGSAPPRRVLVRRARPALAGPSQGRRNDSALQAWALCLILLCGWPARANSEDVVVAVNPATPTGEAIARNTLSAIFGMRLRAWENGTPIRVYVLPDNHAVHGMFCKQILGVFPHQYRTAWDRLVYSGTGQAPLEVANEEEMRARIAGIDGTRAVVVGSEEEMREKLAQNAGAIGYLSREMIDERVRVLQVN